MRQVAACEILRERIVHAQAVYARSLDDNGGEGWADCFAEDCFYIVTTAENHQNGMMAGLMYADSKGMLKDRIAALKEANIYERHSYRHVMGQPLIARRDGDLVYAETPFMVARVMRTGETSLFATGRYLDCYVVTQDSILLQERKVVCDSSRIDTLLALPL
ncbi:aromatic-ring-hydroxylating dioxygenase subunit beta [Sphingobium sp. B2]|uniref:aromatic-ring-hydroxylating dioxygenase subunit beta n=1 Tax=Sphingobium sp. B2 TaxID=2583228 RepID=UPI0011A074C1|nr:nuclear transport factor 2 family protein [Sphingobium sp. B2]